MRYRLLLLLLALSSPSCGGIAGDADGDGAFGSLSASHECGLSSQTTLITTALKIDESTCPFPLLSPFLQVIEGCTLTFTGLVTADRDLIGRMDSLGEAHFDIVHTQDDGSNTVLKCDGDSTSGDITFCHEGKNLCSIRTSLN
jgi:hypothetical protein